jgi:hypothetical protein
MKTQSDPKFIGNRISVVRSKEDIVITITQQIQRWQETLLMTWLAAWTFCGVVFIKYMIQSPHSSDRIFFAICTAVWMYFFYRIAKVFLWRKGGREIIRIHEGKISIINAYWKNGKAEDFYMQNIFKLGKVTSSPTNFLAFLDDSFWIIGGERVGFNYGTSKIRLGKQLASKDAELLVRVIESGMKEFSKKPTK